MSPHFHLIHSKRGEASALNGIVRLDPGRRELIAMAPKSTGPGEKRTAAPARPRP